MLLAAPPAPHRDTQPRGVTRTPGPAPCHNTETGRLCFLGSGLNQNGTKGREPHGTKSFPLHPPTDVFISINYGERPAPAKVMKHGVNQLKHKDFMPWPVTSRSETRIHHCHILLTARTMIIVNLMLCLC